MIPSSAKDGGEVLGKIVLGFLSKFYSTDGFIDGIKTAQDNVDISTPMSDSDLADLVVDLGTAVALKDTDPESVEGLAIIAAGDTHRTNLANFITFIGSNPSGTGPGDE